jgi:hypothetical protein
MQGAWAKLADLRHNFSPECGEAAAFLDDQQPSTSFNGFHDGPRIERI